MADKTKVPIEMKTPEQVHREQLKIIGYKDEATESLVNQYIRNSTYEFAEAYHKIVSAEQKAETIYVAYQTFLKAGVDELLRAEKSIIKDGYVKLTLDEEYRCSDDDLAKYKIEYQFPLHLIHLGSDLHRANLKVSDELKRKWFIE